MKETSKAIQRRLHDPNFANRYFIGVGLDILGGNDPLGLYNELFPKLKSVRAWGPDDGNVQTLADLKDESFDFVHCVQALARVEDPKQALANWFRVLKPGGHLILTLPDEDLYEQGRFPSTFAPGHRWTFTIHKTKSWSPRSINLLDTVVRISPAVEIVKVELLNATYRYKLPRFDQTLTPTGESSIELILRKRPQTELDFGGHPSRPGEVNEKLAGLLTGLPTKR